MQADIVFAIADIQDTLRGMEREMQRRLDLVDKGLLYLLGRNEWGLTDYERVLGWRLIQVRLHGADPKEIIRRFPPEEPAPVERYEPIKLRSVME